MIFLVTLLLRCPRAHADPIVEFSGATGLGVLAVGTTPGRFALSPSASFSVRGERGFFVARDTVSFLGANGGPFGINNETTLGGGLFWDLVNVSAGLSLAMYSLPLCGPQRCGQVRGLAPGASLRLDLFGPYLSGAFGVSVDCAGTWLMGSAAPVWSGVSVRCSAGPLPRFTRISDRHERLIHAFTFWLDRGASAGTPRDRVQHGQPGRVLAQHVRRPRRLQTDSDRRRGRRHLRR